LTDFFLALALPPSFLGDALISCCLVYAWLVCGSLIALLVPCPGGVPDLGGEPLCPAGIGNTLICLAGRVAFLAGWITGRIAGRAAGLGGDRPLSSRIDFTLSERSAHLCIWCP